MQTKVFSDGWKCKNKAIGASRDTTVLMSASTMNICYITSA